MTQPFQTFKRKLSQRNLHKLSNASSNTGSDLTRESISRSCGSRCTLCRLVIFASWIVACEPCFRFAPLISLSPGPRTERAKCGGVHWGELPASTKANMGRIRSDLGNHLARTCCPIAIDPCCWWSRPFSRKDEGRRTSQHPCRISCWWGSGMGDRGLWESENERASKGRGASRLLCIFCAVMAFWGSYRLQNSLRAAPDGPGE